jgi:DNA mismatch repair protein MutS2
MTMLYNNLPTLDLHAIDRDYARILINDFIRDNYNIKNLKVIIIHGIGTGIIRKTTQEVLKKNKLVEDYKIDNFNPGMTVVNIIKKP